MPYRVALVNDDTAFAAELSVFLSDHGCCVRHHGSGQAFIGALPQERPDILLLDNRLPGETGLAVLRHLRQVSNLPCIMLTGAATEVDRILSLELGADDHVEKGASPRELLARIAAVTRRSGSRPAVAAGWRIDEARRDVLRPDGRGCRLTAAEFRVLSVLAGREGELVDRDTICQDALGRTWQAEDRSVDVLVAKLRRKLSGQDCVRSLRGRGYVFTGFVAAAE